MHSWLGPAPAGGLRMRMVLCWSRLDMQRKSKQASPRPDAGRLKPVKFARLTQLLLSERLVVRFAVLFTLAAAVFLVCQTIAYLWLPEGVLRGL